MNAETGPARPAEGDRNPNLLVGPPRRLLALNSIVLVFLLYVAAADAQFSAGTKAYAGYAILAAFAACYPLAIALIAESWRFWTVYSVFVALFIAELPFARATAFVMGVFITIVTVFRLGRSALPVIAILAVAALVIPPMVPSWHDTIGTALALGTPVEIAVGGFITLLSVQAFRRGRELADARAELARLAAENMRIRIARDLHDLLGHSLTTITVKADLACRISGTDRARADQEMADVNALARRALADVRNAVSNYRDITLSGQLETGRELLRAAGITADLPCAVDTVRPEHQELFAWVVREGLTNIVRHSRASSCAVRLSPSSVEIVDDGGGGPAKRGNGLSGLCERVAAAGGDFDAGPLRPRGWRLRISLPPDGGT